MARSAATSCLSTSLAARAWNGGAYAHMRRVLQTDFGSALYRRRQAMIEPVFGHTKFTADFDPAAQKPSVSTGLAVESII